MSTILEKFINKLKGDGQDHIRVSPFGETRLGQVASQDWRRKFFIPHVGEFTSPTCFANWLVTGDEEARHDPKYHVRANVRGYRDYVLYAKFFQLCGMRNLISKEMVDLPFVAYKQHQSGIREYDRWREYASTVKDMIEHILDENRGTRTPYPWPEGLVERIEDTIRAIAGANAGEQPPVETESETESPSTESTAVETGEDNSDSSSVVTEATEVEQETNR